MNSQPTMAAPISRALVGLARTTSAVLLVVLLLFACRTAVAEELELRYYGADWCAPCREIEPMVERWAAMHGDVWMVKFDYDAHEADGLRFGFQGVPVLVLLAGDKFVSKYGHDAQKISDFAPSQLDRWFELVKDNIDSRQP